MTLAGSRPRTGRPGINRGDRLERIGFVGLGLMGLPMSKRLVEAGYPLTVWNRTRAKAAPVLEAGAQWADTPQAVAAASDLVITMVTNSQAVEQVICGPNGVLAGARRGLLIVDMSSIDPDTSRSVAGRARSAGVDMIDAPVTGSVPQAATGVLGIMVGGPAELLERARPVLNHLGTKIMHVGPNGSGATIKAIHNMIFSVILLADAEGLVLAQRAGIDPKILMEVIGAGGGRNGAMETRGPRILDRDFAPRFSLANQYKDLTNALSLAQQLSVPMPTAGAAQHLYRAAAAQGKGDMDSSIVVTVLEELANVTVGGRQEEAIG